MSDQMKKIGLIGIGLVGTALSHNLIESGFEVIGYDINQEQMEKFQNLGGILAKNPQHVADQTDTILLSLLNSEIVKKVLYNKDGILSSQNQVKYIIDTTTADPHITEQIASDLTNRGIKYLDATISGSSLQIKNKEGVFMIGGNEDAFKQNNLIFDILAEDYIYVGKSGMGARSKLAVNLILGLNRLVFAEGLVFAEQIGISPDKALEIFKKTQAYSRIMDAKGEKMIHSDFTTQARINQHRKDVSLIVKMGEMQNIHLPLSKYHLKFLDEMIENGDGDLDVCAVIKPLRENKSNNQKSFSHS